jgi:hypothetical protein
MLVRKHAKFVSLLILILELLWLVKKGRKLKFSIIIVGSLLLFKIIVLIEVRGVLVG